MSDTIQDAEKAAVAAAEQTANAVNDAAAATNDALAAKYPAPAEPVAVAPPVDNSYAAASAYPQPVAMSDAPVATTVDISGPTATGVVAVPYVESPNKVMYVSICLSCQGCSQEDLSADQQWPLQSG